jgi:nitrogen regulatory protein PII 2
MKEVTAIIRLNKVTETKQKLAAGGFPGFTCRKVFGRGKNPLIGRDFREAVGHSVLMPKRMFTIVTEDEHVDTVIGILLAVNSTGQAGDGKIFVQTIAREYQVRRA